MATATGTATAYAGGLVGRNSGTVTDSRTGGTVSASGASTVAAGGLVGSNSSTISNAYATGTVKGTSSGNITKAYGDTATLTFTATGLKNSETVGSVTLASSGAAATAG